MVIKQKNKLKVNKIPIKNQKSQSLHLKDTEKLEDN